MLPIEQCYGFIVILKNKENNFLILERLEKKGDWTFPKGHTEEGENPKETALRELEEETGIKEIEILDNYLIHEEYEVTHNKKQYLKMNDYFIGYVKNDFVKIEEKEIQSYKWATYDEAINLFEHKRRKQVLIEVKNILG